ncbi:MAG TPA: DPP IV N-terminal domain-containing protein, partial [Phycisphaerae bacterium]
MPKTRAIKAEDLFRIKVINEAEISPDGAQVVIAITQPDLPKNKNFTHLYLVAADGGPLRQLTFGDHVNRTPKWSPDGGTLAFISNREKANCVYKLSMAGGEPVRLTDRDGDVSDFDFAPDGRRIVYAYRAKSARQRLQRDQKKDDLARGPEFLHIRRLLHKLDGVGLWNGNYQHLYTVSTAGGRSKRLTRGDYEHLMPRWSPDGWQIAFLCNRRPHPDLDLDNNDIFVMPASGGRMRQVTQRFGPITGYAWSPDGSAFAYLGHFGKQGEFNLHNLHVWIIAADGRRARNLTPGVDNHCFNLTLSDVTEIKFDGAAPVWSHDGSKVCFTVSDCGACHLYEADARPRRSSRDNGQRYPGVRQRVGGDVCVSNVSRARHSDRTALVLTSALDPANVHVIDMTDPRGAPRRITDVNGDLLRTVQLATPEPIRSRGRGGEICGWLLRPPGFKRGRRYPLILQIHGG